MDFSVKLVRMYIKARLTFLSLNQIYCNYLVFCVNFSLSLCKTFNTSYMRYSQKRLCRDDGNQNQT